MLPVEYYWLFWGIHCVCFQVIMSLEIQAEGTFDTPVVVDQTTRHNVVDGSSLQLHYISFSLNFLTTKCAAYCKQGHKHSHLANVTEISAWLLFLTCPLSWVSSNTLLRKPNLFPPTCGTRQMVCTHFDLLENLRIYQPQTHRMSVLLQFPPVNNTACLILPQITLQLTHSGKYKTILPTNALFIKT